VIKNFITESPESLNTFC